MLDIGYLLSHENSIIITLSNSAASPNTQVHRNVTKIFNCYCDGQQKIICDNLECLDEFIRCSLPGGHLRWNVPKTAINHMRRYENGQPI